MWLGRRAASRVRSQLMAAIYDKALKRKDLSGVVAPESTSGKGETNAEPRAGADVGKIVNLMAGDVQTVSVSWLSAVPRADGVG